MSEGESKQDRGEKQEQRIKEVTAYHEAGHAVIALALDRPVQGVSILADRESLGQCLFGKPVFRPSEDWLEREVLIALAGLAAECLRYGDCYLPGGARDRRYARELLLRRADDERGADRLERRLLAKAEHLLSQPEHWRAVERIAEELLRKGRLSGRAARHFFDEALRDLE